MFFAKPDPLFRIRRGEAAPGGFGQASAQMQENDISVVVERAVYVQFPKRRRGRNGVDQFGVRIDVGTGVNTVPGSF